MFLMDGKSEKLDGAVVIGVHKLDISEASLMKHPCR